MALVKTPLPDVFRVHTHSPWVGEGCAKEKDYTTEAEAFEAARSTANIATACEVLVVRVKRWEVSGIEEAHFNIGQVYADQKGSNDSED